MFYSVAVILIRAFCTFVHRVLTPYLLIPYSPNRNKKGVREKIFHQQY